MRTFPRPAQHLAGPWHCQLYGMRHRQWRPIALAHLQHWVVALAGDAARGRLTQERSQPHTGAKLRGSLALIKHLKLAPDEQYALAKT